MSRRLTDEELWREDRALYEQHTSRDFYKELAARMFDVPLAEVTPEQRQTAKQRAFTYSYGLTHSPRSDYEQRHLNSPGTA